MLFNGVEKQIIDDLFVLGLKKNFFSTKQFDKVGGDIHIKSCICTLTNQLRIVITMWKLVFVVYKVGVACITYVSPNVIANHIITCDS